MKLKQMAADFLRGTVCTACTMAIMVITALIFAASWTESLLTLFGGAAAILYLNILLLRTPDKSARISRTVTAFLMYLPLTGVCYLISKIQPDLMLGNAALDDLCFLFIAGFPFAFVLMGTAAVYAAKQKTHPFIPIAVMYVLYAVCQADAFRLATRATLGTEPLNRLEYTWYARCGFFELCALAVINFVIILLLNRSIRHGSTPRPKRLKRIAAALCLYTAFIAVTVLAQMTVYIRVRGLSERRIYASWLAVMLGIAFLILLVKQFVRRLPSAAIVTACAVVMFGMLHYSRPAVRIAEYNIERYETGSLDELDVNMLCGLPDDAYAVMAQHEDTIRQSGQWDCYQEHAWLRGQS